MSLGFEPRTVHYTNWTTTAPLNVIYLQYKVACGCFRKNSQSRCLTAAYTLWQAVIDCVWNVMTHAQKPDFVFRRNGRVHLNQRGRQFSRLLAGELCTSACRVCTARASLCSAVMCRWLVTPSLLLFPLHFSSRASPCAITFQLTDVMVDDTNCIMVLAGLGSGGLWHAPDQGGFGFDSGGNPHEICGRKCDTSTGFFEFAFVFPCHYYFTIALYPSEDWPLVQQRLQRCSLTPPEENK
jgi:hypothetical protein